MMTSRSLTRGSRLLIAPYRRRRSRALGAMVLLASVVMAGPSHGLPINHWWSTGPGAPTDIPAIVIDPSNPSNVYAAWQTIVPGFPLPLSQTYGVGVSANGGTSWSLSCTAECAANAPGPMVIDPKDPRWLYLGTNHGVLRGTPGPAIAWTSVNSGLG